MKRDTSTCTRKCQTCSSEVFEACPPFLYQKMSLKQGFAIGIGALAGGAMGFYIQGRMMEKYRVKTEDFITQEVERRVKSHREPQPHEGNGNDR